jgi:hypothetical protein
VNEFFIFHTFIKSNLFLGKPQVLNHDLIMWRIDILDKLCDVPIALQDISSVNALELLFCKQKEFHLKSLCDNLKIILSQVSWDVLLKIMNLVAILMILIF